MILNRKNFPMLTILEGALSELSSLLLELLDGTLVDTTALVDQVTSGGGLAGIDVSDDCEKDDCERRRDQESDEGDAYRRR